MHAIALGRGVHLGFGIEVGDHFLEGGNRLLHGRDLHQLPAIDRPVAILRGDDEIAALFLQRNQRQAVIRPILYPGIKSPFWSGYHSRSVLPSAYGEADNFKNRAKWTGPSS